MKRSILGLMYLIQGMRNAGIDVDERLQSIGLHADALDASSVIHPRLELDILKIIGAGVRPEQGIFIGQHYALAGYGPLLMLLVTSDTIATAIEKGIQYQGLTHLTGQLKLKHEADRVALQYLPNDLDSDLGMLRAQCEISGTFKFIQDLYKMMSLNVPQIRIELPFARPDQAQALAAYHDYYGHDLCFGHDYAAFWFEQSVLEVKIPSADSITFKTFEEKCIEELQRLKLEDKAPTLVQRVKDYLELQQCVMPTMAETAQALQIPERTLRHQLQQLNTSYKQIREDLIKDKALRLIEYQAYSIEIIAELLGYSEPAAFNHAFKRWFGQSPRQYGK